MLSLPNQRLSRRLRGFTRADAARALIALLALILIVQCVRLFYAIVTPVTPVGAWQPKSAALLSQDQRSALFTRMDPFYRTIATAQNGPANITSLQIQLFGIRENAATGGGSAIIAGSDGIQQSIGTGELIQPGVRLVGVHFDYVELDNNGKRELLYLDQSKAPGATPAPVAGGAQVQPGPAGPTVQSNATISPVAPISPSSIRAGIGFTPRTVGNRVTGITVAEQGDGSAFQAVGFRPGDVIRSVNGQPITSAADIANLSGQLRPGSRLSLEVERGAGTVSLALTIPNGNP